jgi:hypothetical protein
MIGVGPDGRGVIVNSCKTSKMLIIKDFLNCGYLLSCKN